MKRYRKNFAKEPYNMRLLQNKRFASLETYSKARLSEYALLLR